MDTPPVESAVTLVETLLNEARRACWKRLPPLDAMPTSEVREARGETWTLVVARWRRDSEFHYEATAYTKLKNIPVFCRIPEADACAVWAISELQTQ